jgi:ferrous iron transport protein B
MVEGAGSEVANTMGLTAVASLAYMMFNLFSPPCFAALGAMRAEMQDKKWFWAGVFLQLGTGYTVAFIVYQAGTLFATGGLGAGFIPGLLAVLAMAAIVLLLVFKGNREETV